MVAVFLWMDDGTVAFLLSLRAKKDLFGRFKFETPFSPA